MSNPVAGLIEAKTSDGRVIKLLFDFNTFIDAEEATGLDSEELMKRLAADPKDKAAPKLSLKQQRAFFWCAMREHQPEIDEREAGRLLVELAGDLEKAMKSALPKPEEAGGEADGNPREPAGTGTNN